MASTISFDKPSFSVDSRNRENCDTCSIEDFEICVELPPNNKFNQVSLSSVVIPKSYYNVTDRLLGTDDGTNAPDYNSTSGAIIRTYQHNQFLLYEGTNTPGDDAGQSTASALITIDLANYNSNNFPVVMKNLLETASPNGWIYDITYPDILTQADTKKWTFTVSGNGSTQPIFYFPTIQPINEPANFGARNRKKPVRITEIMGMDASAYGVTSPSIDLTTKGQRVFSGNTLESDFQIDFELTKYIVIKSDICLDQGNNTPDNAIIGVIPVIGVEDGGVINYELQQLEDESKYLANNRKNLYRFSLFDDHNEPLNLNGINWFIKLFVYEYNPYFELAINDIKIRQLQKQAEAEVARARIEAQRIANPEVNQPQTIL